MGNLKKLIVSIFAVLCVPHVHAEPVVSSPTLPGAQQPHASQNDEYVARDSGGWQGTAMYNDERISNAVPAVLAYLEGSFFSIVEMVAGLIALVFFLRWAETHKKVHLRWCLIMVLISVAAFLRRKASMSFFQ